MLGALGCGGPEADELSAPSAAAQATLTLLHTSDLHSRVWPFRERISPFEAELGLGQAGALEELAGFARLATVLERERRAGAALWLDSGDVLEGAEVFQRFQGQVELELLSALGLSAMALGNHELSLPARELADWLQSAPFPVLAANLGPASGSLLAPRLGATAFVQAGQLKLGVVGVANPGSPPELASRGNAWGLRVAEDLAFAVQNAIDQVAPRADLVVLLTHLGLDGDRDLVRAISGADLVLGGHQHIVTESPAWEDDCVSPLIRARRGCSPRPVPIVHSGAYGKVVSRVRLVLAPSGQVALGQEVTQIELAQVPLASGVPEHPDVLAQLQPFEAPASPLLGFAPQRLPRRSALGGDSALGNLVTDAMHAAAASDVVLLNSSGLRGDLEAGQVLVSDLELVLPFDEPWLLARVSGAQLKQGLKAAARRSASRDCESALQVAGLGLRVDCTACREQGGDCLRTQRAGVLGSGPLRDDEILSVALPAYLAQVGADFEELRDLGRALSMGVVEALTQHLGRLPRASTTQPWPWILGGTDGRIQMQP